MTRIVDHLIRPVDVLLSEQTDGEVRVNVGYATTGDGVAKLATVWGVDGFYSMPNAPDAAGACEALVLDGGDKKRVVAMKDTRWASNVGNIAEGDRMIATNSPARVMLRKAKAQVVIFSENAADDDSTMLVEVNGASGEIQIVNGGSFIRVLKDNITLAADGATLEISADGVSICGKHFAANVGGGNLGTVGPVPPPQGAMSVCGGATGVAAVGSSKWTVALLVVLWVAGALWSLSRST